MRVLTDRVGGVPTDQPHSGEGRSVAVVGAGITGLVAAYELRRRGVNVTLYEASPHAGGAIRTTHAGGFLAEHGPNSFMATPAVESLLAGLDLQRDVVEANPVARNRFVSRDGTLQPFPLSPPALVRTRLLSTRAKLRLLMEPVLKAGNPLDDESVASFVRRRLGREVLDYAVDPFISGVFAGDPEQLSIAHALPRLAAMERAHGSLGKALVAGLRAKQRDAKQRDAKHSDAKARDTKQSDEKPGDARPQRSSHRTMISFAGGMGALIDALEASLVGTLRLRYPVRLLHRQETRWVVEAGQDGSSRTHSVDAVVMATPTHVMTAMELPAALRRHAAPLEAVEYPPLSTITLGFRRADIAHALDGFGMLIPAVERRHLLGALFSSSLFPGRAPADHVTITCFVGGARQPARARQDTGVLVEAALRDLRDLLGARGDPVFVKHVFWPRAIPQYNVGYGEVIESAEHMELANPGFYLAGNYRGGVAVGDCVASGQRVAEKVQAYLARAG